MRVEDFLSSSDEKPILTIVSPLPPTKSGIADYVARQLGLLEQHYRLALVDDDLEQPASPYCFSGIKVSSALLLEIPELQRRVLYHIGNSPVHLKALKLLAKVPGLVVLHDFFLSDVQQYEDIILLGKTRASYRELVHAHGYGPLLRASEAGQPLNLSDYPCNLSVLERARKVLLHSDFVLQQATAWYGQRINQYLGRIGFAHETALPVEQVAARRALGLDPHAYIVGTFGFATPAKCLETLINAWVTGGFAHNTSACLLICGEFLDDRYQARIRRLLELRQCTNVRMLGYLAPEDYNQYLAAVDLAVQLRVRSRGETSAALIDCLAAGVPVVANNHGFVEDLPDYVLWKIAQKPDLSELTAVLEHLYDAKSRREILRTKALAYLEQSCNPHQVNTRLVEEIEATQSNSPSQYNQQLLFDVTAVARFDLRTGIQRVVRALLRELIDDAPDGYRVLPVYLDSEGVYRYAHRFMLKTLGFSEDCLEDQVVQVHAHDVYLGADLHTTNTVLHAPVYDAWRKAGVRIINVLYDLLPLRSPQWFPAMVEPDFKAWASHIARHSDAVLAISRTVADDFARWMREQGIDEERTNQLEIGWFHLGSDLDASVPSTGLPDDAAQILDRISSTPSFLMVGTVEPRKGHAQTLAAFEQLWSEGHDYNLIVVGKEGWHVEDIAGKLRRHSRLGQQIFWLEGISDEYLGHIYPRCEALIAASEGEGFGLPLIEAAHHHIPVIARDIPVFREVGGDGAYYFKADTSAKLATELKDWLALAPENRPDSTKIRCQTWKESASQLKQFLEI